MAQLSAEFCIIWVASNYFYNAGLATTSVSASTVLSNSSSIFVYLFGLCLLAGSSFSPLKAFIVLVSFSGIILVTFATAKDGDSKKSSFKGDLFSLFSAMCYGLYATWLKKRVTNEEHFPFSYFLGFVGLFNVIFLWPFFFILHFTGVETFAWPNKTALSELVVNAIIGTVISDYCWARSVVLLGPLMTTMGIALTIPISMIVDSFT